MHRSLFPDTMPKWVHLICSVAYHSVSDKIGQFYTSFLVCLLISLHQSNLSSSRKINYSNTSMPRYGSIWKSLAKFSSKMSFFLTWQTFALTTLLSAQTPERHRLSICEAGRGIQTLVWITFTSLMYLILLNHLSVRKFLLTWFTSLTPWVSTPSLWRKIRPLLSCPVHYSCPTCSGSWKKPIRSYLFANL